MYVLVFGLYLVYNFIQFPFIMDKQEYERMNKNIQSLLEQTLSDIDNTISYSDDEDEIDNIENDVIENTDDSDADPNFEVEEEELESSESDNESSRIEGSPQRKRSRKITSTPRRIDFPPPRSPESPIQLPGLQSNDAVIQPSTSSIPPQQVTITSPHIIEPTQRVIRAPNRHIWNSQPGPQNVRTASRNIVFSRRDVVGTARDALTPDECFLEMFDETMFNKIIQHTNAEMNRKKVNYNNRTSFIHPIDIVEMKAFVAVLVNSAVCKDNHLAVRELFDTEYSGSCYKSIMSSERFEFILTCIRFDDRETRVERKKEDPFAPIRELWDDFTSNCRSKYKPGSYVTVDEQLLGFRGKCMFRMYIPNKPSKYGIKIVLCCDNTTYYMIHGVPYIGKKTPTRGLPVAEYFVKEVTKSIHGSKRSVTMDNWFTSVKLADDLLQDPFNLTVIGTIRLNRKGVPKELANDKRRPVNSSMFLFDKEKTLVSFKPKSTKVVVVLSTMHEGKELNQDTKKPAIIHTYNETKGAVDTLDKMCNDISCSRKTRRWPLCVFYGMLNIAFVNAYVIYCINNLRQGIQPLNRKQFMKELGKNLSKPHKLRRLEVPTLKRNVKILIAESLGIPLNPTPPQAPGARKTCRYCPSALHKMTTNYCSHCNQPICGQHRAMVCKECDSQ